MQIDSQRWTILSVFQLYIFFCCTDSCFECAIFQHWLFFYASVLYVCLCAADPSKCQKPTSGVRRNAAMRIHHPIILPLLTHKDAKRTSVGFFAVSPKHSLSVPFHPSWKYSSRSCRTGHKKHESLVVHCPYVRTYVCLCKNMRLSVCMFVSTTTYTYACTVLYVRDAANCVDWLNEAKGYVTYVSSFFLSSGVHTSNFFLQIWNIIFGSNMVCPQPQSEIFGIKYWPKTFF